MTWVVEKINPSDWLRARTDLNPFTSNDMVQVPNKYWVGVASIERLKILTLSSIEK